MNIFKKLFGRKKTQEPEFVVEIHEEIVEESVVEETDPVILEYIKLVDECDDEETKNYYKAKLERIRARG